MSYPSFEETNNPGYDEVFNNEEEKLKKELQTKVSYLIENGLISTVFQYIENGYVITKSQKIDIKRALHEKNFLPNYFEELIKLNIKIPDMFMPCITEKVTTNFVEYFLRFSYVNYLAQFDQKRKLEESYIYLNNVYYKNNLHESKSGIKYEFFENWVKEKAKEGTLNHILFDYYLNSFDVKEDIDFNVMYNDFNKVSGFLFHNISKDKIDSFIAALNKRNTFRKKDFIDLIEGAKDIVEKVFNLNNKEEIKENKNTVANTDIMKESLFNKVVERFNKLEPHEEIKKELIEIENKYLFLKKNKNSLPTQNNFYIEKVYDDIIPNLLTDYLSLKSSLRNTLKNAQGFTAKEILTSSLYEVKAYLNNITADMNNNNLSNLSANDNYFQEIKKGMKI